MSVLLKMAEAFWATAQQMAPWLLGGFLLAGGLSLFFTPERVRRILGGERSWRGVLWAVALGVPLPLCSCGVLPVAVGLRKGGAGRGATAAFLLATPQTGVDSILATYALLGGAFAVVRPLVAVVSGVVGGGLIGWLESGAGEAAEGVPEAPAEAAAPRARGLRALWEAVQYGFGLLGNVSGALAVGLLLSAGVVAFLPPDAFSGPWLGNDWVAFPLMLLVGMPLYVCSTASIPLALALMSKGLSPGAALVLLVVGPALNGASLTTLFGMLGARGLALFLGVLSGVAVGAGVALNSCAGWLFPEGFSAMAGACCEGGQAWFSALCGAVLLGAVGFHVGVRPLLRWLAGRRAGRPAGVYVGVRGMRCDHCRGTVAKLLRGYPGVQAVEPAGAEGFWVVGAPLPESLGKDLAALGFELEA